MFSRMWAMLDLGCVICHFSACADRNLIRSWSFSMPSEIMSQDRDRVSAMPFSHIQPLMRPMPVPPWEL